MAVSNVKITIVERLLQIVAPHPCLECGKVGTILCPSCKYDINHEPFLGCFMCGAPQTSGICTHHKLPVERSFVVGRRTGSLKGLLDVLKFSRAKEAAKIAAELLNYRLPCLPAYTVLVPIPTSAAHIRQRGYDQVDLVVRYIAALRGLPIERLLVWTKNTTQHSVNRAQRATQAQDLYKLAPGAQVNSNHTYLIIDDIITTGATVRAAVRVLHKACPDARIWVAALAYQLNDLLNEKLNDQDTSRRSQPHLLK